MVVECSGWLSWEGDDEGEGEVPLYSRGEGVEEG